MSPSTSLSSSWILLLAYIAPVVGIHRTRRLIYLSLAYIALAVRIHRTHRVLIVLPSSAPRASSCHFPDTALNPPSLSPPPRPRRHVFSPVSLCQPPAIIVPLLPNTTRDPLLFVYDRRQDQATRRAHRAHACNRQQQPQPTSYSRAPLRTLLRL